MKSLNFQKLNISGADVLTRLEMKRVIGGYEGEADPDGSCSTKCTVTQGNTTWSYYCSSYKKPGGGTVCMCNKSGGSSCK
jgi:hypothetical protein